MFGYLLWAGGTVRDGLNDPDHKNRISDLFLGPGVVSIGFALKFRYGRLNVREFSLEKSRFRNFGPGSYLTQVVQFPVPRELLDTSSSRSLLLGPESGSQVDLLFRS